jgi:hypothetical protein
MRSIQHAGVRIQRAQRNLTQGRGQTGFILPEIIEAARRKNPIESVAQEVLRLRKSGSGLVGLCPFHSEKTPSFHVNPSRQKYKCFGCGDGGDVIAFIQRVHNLTFLQAVKFLAQRAGIAIHGARITPEMRQRISAERVRREHGAAREAYISARQDAINHKFYRLGKLATEAEDYLRERVFDVEFAPRACESLKVELSWYALLDYRTAEHEFFGRDGVTYGSGVEPEFPAYNLVRIACEFETRQGEAIHART